MQYGASDCPQQSKNAEFAVCTLQQELKAGGADAQTIPAIQNAGAAGEPQPEGAQQVVPDAGCQAQ